MNDVKLKLIENPPCAQCGRTAKFEAFYELDSNNGFRENEFLCHTHASRLAISQCMMPTKDIMDDFRNLD